MNGIKFVCFLRLSLFHISLQYSLFASCCGLVLCAFVVRLCYTSYVFALDFLVW